MIKNLVEFRRDLEKINEWWLTSRVREAERFPFKREVFEKIKAEIDTRRAILLLGTRRVGKSILLKQTIASLIEDKVNPRNILYYSLDDPTLFTQSDNLMKDLLEYFLENIAIEGKKYVFFDEAHLYGEWYRWIKSYYDRYEDIKFVLSGSSSLSLQKEASKYLRGRVIEVEIFPLSFSEFLKLSGLEIERFSLNTLFEIDEFKLRETWFRVKNGFGEYLLVGGFPEWFELRGTEDALDKWFRRLLEDVPKKAIYEDIVNLFEIKNPKTLELIFTFIAANQSRVLAYETINDVAKLDRATLINYIEFLKSSYLIVEILKYAGIKEQMKAKKKFLILDQGLRNAILREHQIREENAGFVLENLIGSKLFYSSKLKNENLFYWRINDEVDFIAKNKEALPVEVKYRSEIKPKDLKGLLNFMKKSRASKGVVVTKDVLKREKIDENEILFIPAWLFLLTI